MGNVKDNCTAIRRSMLVTPAISESKRLDFASRNSVIDAAHEMKEFVQLISPLSQATFLSEFWQKDFLYLPGSNGRFRSLMTWDDVNDLLAKDWGGYRSPPIRLYLESKPVDPRRYLTPVGVNSGGLISCLSQGATLIVDFISNSTPAVRQLAEECERALEATTNVNLYASWRSQKGFDLHWDVEDTLIVQLSGRKQWKVYRPTRLHPLKDDAAVPPKPTEQPVWDGVLEDGDLIYFPRGWWHTANSLNEPSLHLTFGFTPSTGVDLLKWFIGKLDRHAEVRRDLPRHSDYQAQRQYVSVLRKLLIDGWDDDVFANFLRDWDARRHVRPRIQLPFAPCQQNAPLTMETRDSFGSSTLPIVRIRDRQQDCSVLCKRPSMVVFC